MIGLAAIFLLAQNVSSSEPPELWKCEAHVRSLLGKPYSYKRTNYASLSLGGYWEVGIEFSYLDDQGRRVTRAWQTCDYPIRDGQADISRFVRLDGSLPGQGAR